MRPNAFSRPDVGKVCHPLLVGRIGLELAVQNVVGNGTALAGLQPASSEFDNYLSIRESGGTHYLEVQVVDRLYAEAAARAYGLAPG